MLRVIIIIWLMLPILFATGCSREQKFYIHEGMDFVPPQEPLPEVPYEDEEINCGCDLSSEGFPLIVTTEDPARVLYNQDGELEFLEEAIILQGRCQEGLITIEFERVSLGLEGRTLSCQELRRILRAKGLSQSFVLVFEENL